MGSFVKILLSGIVALLCAVEVGAQTSLDEMIAVADATQESGDIAGAIELFKKAEDYCRQTKGDYNEQMQYICACIVTCLQETGDYESYVRYFMKLDDVSQHIGYLEEVPESFTCFEIARGLISKNASDDELKLAKQYMARGESKERDYSREPYWEWLTHKLSYIEASRMQDLDSAATILEREYQYFMNECRLPKEEIVDVIYECGMDWYENLMLRLCLSDAHKVIEEIKAEQLKIDPDFYSLELETGRLYVLADLKKYDESIRLGTAILSSIPEDDETYDLLFIVRYNVGRCYNSLSKYEEALMVLQAIYDSPYAYRLEGLDTNYIKAVIAYSLLGLDRMTESENMCNEILKDKPRGDTLGLVSYILGAIANKKSDAKEIGYIDDYIIAYKNQVGEYVDTSFAEIFVRFAERYIDFGLYTSALNVINDALNMFDERNDTDTYDYYIALCIKTYLSVMHEDLDSFSKYIQIVNDKMVEIKRLMDVDDHYDEKTELLQWMQNALYLAFSYSNYQFQKAFLTEDITKDEREKAEKMIKENINGALNITKDLNEDIVNWLLENNPNRLGMIYQMNTWVYRDTEEYDEGIEYLNGVLSTFPKDCDMYSVLDNLRNYMYVKKDGPAQHVDFIKNNYAKDKKYAKEMLSSLGSKRRSEMWKQFYGNINNYVEYARQGRDNAELNEIAYDAILMSKGLLLQCDMDFAARISRANDKELSGKYARCRQLWDSNPDEADILEREILRSLDFTQDNYLYNASWRDVKQSLRPDEYAVEFRTVAEYGINHYVAFVVGSTYTAPRMVEICNSTELQGVDGLTATDYEKLGKMVWSKFDDMIPQSSTIYFSPDQQLHALPLEYVQDYADPGKSIADRWTIYRVSSTRELVQSGNAPKENKVEVYGGLDYYVSAQELLNDYSANSTHYVNRSFDANDARGGVSVAADLPGSKREVEQITTMLKQSNTEVIPYTGPKGTESSFKAYAGKKGNILHISTHGFYISPMDGERSQLSMILGVDNVFKTYEEALNRSGLMMSGVNETILGRIEPTECEDGLLTAKEISGLNLGNTDLVILSACETGTGAITGDGVFGLQRGFKLAGVRSMMMSLWKVDDSATEKLMVEFYKNWLNTNDLRESLARAQKAVRDTPGWESPQYWAGFILLDALN